MIDPFWVNLWNSRPDPTREEVVEIVFTGATWLILVVLAILVAFDS